MKPDMTMEQSLYQACAVLAAINGIQASMMKSDDRLIIDLQMDSVELIELLIKLEEFGIEVNESQLSKNFTVGDVAKMIFEAQ